MMNIEKLIERLYQHDKDYGEGRTQNFFRVCLDCKDAATALSTLQAENEKLRAELEQVKQKYSEAQEAICAHCMDVPCRGERCYWWCEPQKED